MSHLRNGQCPACQAIFDKFHDFNEDLYDFFTEIQAMHPEFHISCAGRGEAEQEALFARKATRAHWKQSSHNYNAAIDTWVMGPSGEYTLPEDYYINVIAPKIPPWIEWYGRPEYKHEKNEFYELPHLEIKNWREMLAQKLLRLVE